MSVRPATVDDIDSLIDIANAVVNEDRWVSAEPGDPRFTPDYWVEALQDAHGIVFVACDESVVGYLRVSRQPDGRHAIGMVVREDHRRRGHGRALLNAAIRWARAKGVSDLHLGVFGHNEGARRLYEQSGFRALDVFPRYCVRSSGDAWDLILMQCDIPSDAEPTRGDEP